MATVFPAAREEMGAAAARLAVSGARTCGLLWWALALGPFTSVTVGISNLDDWLTLRKQTGR
jgi:hypothetical protein